MDSTHGASEDSMATAVSVDAADSSIAGGLLGFLGKPLPPMVGGQCICRSVLIDACCGSAWRDHHGQGQVTGNSTTPLRRIHFTKSPSFRLYPDSCAGAGAGAGAGIPCRLVASAVGVCCWCRVARARCIEGILCLFAVLVAGIAIC